MTFAKSESGAVTVDWVVLTAGLVGLGLATMAVVSSGVEDLTGDVDDTLQAGGIIQTYFGLTPINAVFNATDNPDLVAQGWGHDVFGDTFEGWYIGGRTSLIENGYGGADLADAAYGIDLWTGDYKGMSRTLDGIDDGRSHTITVSAADYSTTGLAEVIWGGAVIGTINAPTGTVGDFTFEITGGAGDGSDLLEIVETVQPPSGIATMITDIQID